MLLYSKLLWELYYGRLQFKLRYVHAMVKGIVVVGELTRCALLHCVCDLKAAPMDLSCLSLIGEPMLYDFKFGHTNGEPNKKHLLCNM